jgi:hypothetical protein
MLKIDNFCQGAKLALTMNPRKPDRMKSKSAGIALEPDLVKRARVLAAQRGFNSLSALVRVLLLRELSGGKVQLPPASTAAADLESASTPMLGDDPPARSSKPRQRVRQPARLRRL